MLPCRWGKLAEGSTDDSDKCPHSVKHLQDFQQTAEVYTTILAKGHSILELFTFHIPLPLTTSKYVRVVPTVRPILNE